MHKDLVDGKIGSAGQYDVEIHDGKLCLGMGVNAGIAELNLVAKLDPIPVLEKILLNAAAKTATPLDDLAVKGVIAMAKKAFGIEAPAAMEAPAAAAEAPAAEAQ